MAFQGEWKQRMLAKKKETLDYTNYEHQKGDWNRVKKFMVPDFH